MITLNLMMSMKIIIFSNSNNFMIKRRKKHSLLKLRENDFFSLSIYNTLYKSQFFNNALYISCISLNKFFCSYWYNSQFNIISINLFCNLLKNNNILFLPSHSLNIIMLISLLIQVLLFLNMIPSKLIEFPHLLLQYLLPYIQS